MNNAPLLSVITVNLNNKAGLQKTITSVLNQTFTGYEFLVIDGGSLDGSVDIIKANASKINYWVSEYDNGIYSAMNKGILQAKGKHLLFLNSGDWLHEDGLKKAFEYCSDEDILYFDAVLCYNNTSFETIKYPDQLTMKSFFKRTIGHQSTFIKRDLFNKYGLYNEANTIHSDYEFWIKTIVMGEVTCKHIDQYISYYDMGGRSSKPSQLSKNEVKRILSQSIPQRILTDYEYWYKREAELQIMEWVKSKTILYQLNVVVFKIATRCVALKKLFFSRYIKHV